MNMKMTSCQLRPQLRLAGWLLMLTLTAVQCVSSAHSQAINAQILGTVVDTTGALIPNATIEAKNTGTGLGRTVTSSATGDYVIPSLPVGTYTLTVVAKGFKTYTQSGIALVAGQQARVVVTLQVGSATQTVQVAANALQVNTTSASLRTEISTTQLQQLPLNTRDTLQLITLVPGVGDATLPAAVTNQRDGPTFSVNGSRINGSEVELDGAILVTGLYNRPVNLPNPDSIGEFSLLTSNYSAEFGHASGGAFVAVSKAGTNTFHGSAWEFLRNDALDARNWFAPAPAAKPTLKQNQFGVAGGGPIWKNKAFFFATYEGLRIRQVTLFNLPTNTPAERAGTFPGTAADPLWDPFTNSPYPYNAAMGTYQIPQSEWDPVSVAFMQTYIPVANATTGLFASQVPTPTTGNQYTVRVDYHPTNRDDMYVRFFHMNDTAVSPPPYGYYLSPTDYDNFSEPDWGTTVRDTHIFNPNLVGDFGFSDTNITTNGTPEGTIITLAEMGGLYSTGGYNVSPAVSVSGVTSFGSGNPWYENTALKQADAELTWTKGRNLWEFGALALREAEEIDWIDTNSSGNPYFSGSYTGSDGATEGTNWADYLIGKPISFEQATPYYGNDHTVQMGFYAQDTFKASPRLTLDLGIRYDAFDPWREIGLDSPAVVLTNPTYQSTRFPTAPPGLSFPGDPGIPDGIMFMDKTDFAPRLGFSYDVLGDGKTVLRGGYGIYYNAPGAITLDNEIEAPPFETELTFTPNTFTNPYLGTGYTDPYPYSYLNPGTNPVWAFPAQFYAPDPLIKNAFTQQYNFNVQHEFAQDFMVQVGYVGSLGDRLWVGNQANAAPYSAGGSAANAQSRRPFLPQYYAGITRIANIGNSNYNSLQVTVRKRLSASYTLQAAYTYSKSLDTGSYADADGGSEQNPANPIAPEYARSDFNQKQILSINGVWYLPQFKNLGVLRYGAGGWELSGIVNFSSGFPFSVDTGSPAPWLGAGRDIGNLRMNLTGVNPCAGCGSRDSWARTGYFNTSAFGSPLNPPYTYGTFGNDGRNSLVGPSTFDTDMSLVKNFPLLRREGSKVQVRADFFNLFNRAPFDSPNASSSSSAFGLITSAGPAREVQLAARLDF
ncbi:MAG: TonB-dependent receptor [Acidobacteriaceae bacterium]